MTVAILVKAYKCAILHSEKKIHKWVLKLSPLHGKCIYMSDVFVLFSSKSREVLIILEKITILKPVPCLIFATEFSVAYLLAPKQRILF